MSLLAAATGVCPCSTSSRSCAPDATTLQRTSFLCKSIRKIIGGQKLSRSHISNGSSCRAFFKFKNPLRESSEDAGIYGSQARDDYSEDDVEHYFNYMGMLATEGTYDRLNQMMSSGLEPVDLLLLMAASEEDAPKIAELLRAGANLDVKDAEGRTARQIAKSPAVLALLDDPKTAFSF